MPEYEKILSSVLARIAPTEKEKEEDKTFISNFISRLDALTPKEIAIELAGSLSRDTNLRGDRDFDVFMLFPKHYSLKELEELGLKWAKEIVKGHKYELAWAQHPYLRAWIAGREIDIVPSYKIERAEEMLTAVDRSPLHTRYILANMTEEQKNEVRLLKQFCRGIGVYGAEGKIQGFSGYLCELFILAHKNFLSFLEAAAKWRGTPVYQLVGHEDEEALKKKFRDAAIIFIDPTDARRNVAAAISKTSLSLFIHSARMFLQKPSTKFFFPTIKKVDKRWMATQLKARDTQIFALEFDRPAIIDEILWPQLYKFAAKIAEHAKVHEFLVFDTEVNANKKCLVIVEFEIYQLPRMKKIVGPPLWLDVDVSTFIKKHKVTEPIWFEKDKILAIGKRKFTTAEQFLKNIILRAADYGVPPDVLKVKKSLRLLKVQQIVKRYPDVLFAYLQKRNIP